VACAFGMPIEHSWLHSENVLDETGVNTSGKNQANNGGEKKVVAKGMVPHSAVGVV
jgi:hypothetical protein